MVVITVAVMAAAMEVVITVEAMVAAMEVVITAAVIVAAMEVVITAAVMVAAMEVVVILNQIPLTPINLPEQKGGKTEVIQTLLKTMNMKVAGAGEKGEFPMKAMLQAKKISNPFLQASLLLKLSI